MKSFYKDLVLLCALLISSFSLFSQSTLPIPFDDSTISLDPFGNNMTANLDVDPLDQTNNVLCLMKNPVPDCWAGVTIGGNCLGAPIDFSMGTVITIDIFSPEVGAPILLKIEDCTNAAIATELIMTTTVANAWETLSFDFANGCPGSPNNSFTYNKLSIFPQFTCSPDACGMPNPGTAPASANCYYIDNITFVPSVAMTECTGMGAITGAGAGQVPNGYTYSIIEDGAGNVTVSVTVVDAPVGLVGFLNGPGGIFAAANGTGGMSWTLPVADLNSPINVFLNWIDGGVGDIEPIAWNAGDCEPVANDCSGNGAITGAGAGQVPNGYTYNIIEDGAGNVTVSVTVVDAPVGLVGFLNGPGGIFAAANGTGGMSWTLPVADLNSPINVFLNWIDGGVGDIEPIAWNAGDCGPVTPDECTLASGNCTACAEACETYPIDLSTAPVENAAGEFGPGFCLFGGPPQPCPIVGTPAPNYDAATNMGTFTIPAGAINAFTVAALSGLTFPEIVNDVCLTADINVVSGTTPFLIEFRIENGTGAPGNGGQAYEWNVMVDGTGMCSIGGSLADGTPANGFTFTPQPSYTVAFGIADFTGNPVAEDIVVEFSNVVLNICGEDVPVISCASSTNDVLMADGQFDSYTGWNVVGAGFNTPIDAGVGFPPSSAKVFGQFTGGFNQTTVSSSVAVSAGELVCFNAFTFNQGGDNILGNSNVFQMNIEFLMLQTCHWEPQLLMRFQILQMQV